MRDDASHEVPCCRELQPMSQARQSEGTTEERQLELARDYASRHGLTLDERSYGRRRPERLQGSQPFNPTQPFTPS